jgi:hypothetical protein
MEEAISEILWKQDCLLKFLYIKVSQENPHWGVMHILHSLDWPDTLRKLVKQFSFNPSNFSLQAIVTLSWGLLQFPNRAIDF